jgi:hypothetical protein
MAHLQPSFVCHAREELKQRSNPSIERTRSSEPLRDLIGFYTHLLTYMHLLPVMLRHVAKSAAGALPCAQPDGLARAFVLVHIDAAHRIA